MNDERTAIWAEEAAIGKAFMDPTIDMVVHVNPRPSLKVISGEGHGGEPDLRARPALRLVSAVAIDGIGEIGGGTNG